MENKEFKRLFGELARHNGFEGKFGGWFKQGNECIIVLDLQKSNFGNYFDLNIKIYIQGMLGNTYAKSKELVKKDTGDVFRRQPDEYSSAFDFDQSMDDEKRVQMLRDLFVKFIVPFADKALSRQGIKELAKENRIFLLPAVKDELGF